MSEGTKVAITLHLDRYEREALAFPCGQCGAAAGEWCHTPRNGRPATGLHVNRFDTAVKECEL